MKTIEGINTIPDKIISISAFCLSSKYGDNNSFGQPLGVKTVGFVEVITDKGVIGYGEAYAAIYIPEIMNEVCKSLEKYFIGRNVKDLSLSSCVSEIPFIGRNGLLQSISGAIDTAIWDVRGKVLNLPVYKLFETNFQKKEVYYSGGSVIFNADEIKKEVDQLARSEKFFLYKMRIGHQLWKNDIKRIQAAFEIFNNNNLMIDAIMGTIRPAWNEKEAREKIDELEDYNIRWIEEPLFPDNIMGLSRLSKSVNVPLAAGEAYSGITEIETLINLKALKYIQVDATHTGSYHLCYDLSKKAKAKNIQSVTHVWGSNLALFANTHMALANENISLIEIPSVDLELNKYLNNEGVIIDKGTISLTDAPGYGILFDDDLKNKFSYIPNSGYFLPLNKNKNEK
tara:strand:+ start:6131 stop:7324 length:1194 start_codon:yes stop_codon:yes gene_type:complete